MFKKEILKILAGYLYGRCLRPGILRYFLIMFRGGVIGVWMSSKSLSLGASFIMRLDPFLRGGKDLLIRNRSCLILIRRREWRRQLTGVLCNFLMMERRSTRSTLASTSTWVSSFKFAAAAIRISICYWSTGAWIELVKASAADNGTNGTHGPGHGFLPLDCLLIGHRWW